ncbi:MAG: PLP-dependent aminotransferase family protein [Myxococcota bacterium]
MAEPSAERSGRAVPPAYRRIAASIRARIEAGELAPGDRLAPIRALADELGVHRDTVSQAYETLRAQGLVESGVGRGTFVAPSLGVRAAPTAPAASLAFAPTTEELLAFDAGRPRFPSVALGGAPDAEPSRRVESGTAPREIVALHKLVPDPALYPAAAFRRALHEVLGETGPELLLYGGAQGHVGLREAIARRLAAAGAPDARADDVVLCHGASQGIALALRVFASAGDAVAVEVPTYANVLATLVALGVRAEPVPMQREGTGAAPDLDALDRALARPDVRAFYTIPTFHNPLGTSTDLAHRRALVGIAARHGKPVIEDAFEMDLRYEGGPVPSLAAVDDAGLVVQLLSFSKSLFPGVRAGAIAARGRVVDALVALKHATDLSDSLPLQAALARLLESGAYDRHLAKLRRELRARRDAMLAALERHMPEGTTWTRPSGGYQLWVDLPREPHAIDARDLLADAAREGVLFAPGSEFAPGRPPSGGLRLTVAQAGPAAIERGIAALARVVRAHQGEDRAARQSAAVQL